MAGTAFGQKRLLHEMALWFDRWGANVGVTVAMALLAALVWQVRTNEVLRGQLAALQEEIRRPKPVDNRLYEYVRELEKRVNMLEQRH